MTQNRTMMSTERSDFRSVATLLFLLVLAGWLLGSQIAQAKPQIQITCASSGSGGYEKFSLCWSSTGNSSWPNYIYTDLYNSSGAELTGYPQEDANIYYIAATQLTCPDVNTSPTGSESDSAAVPGGTVVISVSGEWNGNTCPACPAGRGCPAPGKDVIPPPAAGVDVRQGDKRPVPGPGRQIDVWLEVSNSSQSTLDLRFVYGLFKKTDPDNGTIIPLTETDPNGPIGNRHVFRRIRKNGSTRYQVGPRPQDDPYIVKELRVDLTNGVDATDYVYLDVFVVDLNSKRAWPVRRIQVQP
jgi:hypothetical protein